MTEAEWLECTDSRRLLRFLAGKASDRKLRLFACACCRRIWHFLPDERSRRAVEIAERYADAQATEEELEKAASAASAVWDAEMERAATEGTWAKGSLSPPYTASAAAYNVAIPLGWWGGAPAFVAPDEIAREVSANSGTEGAGQCALLRDIFGNPFRSAGTDPSRLTPAVVGLARTIYEDRAFDRLPELADALESAGRPDSDILSHCRSLGPHVRGCWVLDLILGKQ